MCSVVLELGGVNKVEFVSSEGAHNNIEDTELSGSQRSNHEPSGGETDSAESVHTFFSSDVSETFEHTTVTTSSLLVNLGEESISGVRDSGSDNTSNNTGLNGYADVLSLGELIRGGSSGGVDHFGSFSLDGELGHSVRNLFAKERDESRVESSNETHFGVEFLSAFHHGSGIVGLGDKSDSAGFIRAEEAISNSFGHSGREKVDLLSVLISLLFSHLSYEVGLEVFDSTEFEPSLDEVSLASGSKTSHETTHTFSGNNLSGDFDHTTVILDGIKLDLCLDDIDGDDTTVSGRAANTTGKGTLKVICKTERTLSH